MECSSVGGCWCRGGRFLNLILVMLMCIDVLVVSCWGIVVVFISVVGSFCM